MHATTTDTDTKSVSSRTAASSETMRVMLHLNRKSWACSMQLHGQCGLSVNGGEAEGIPCLCHCHEALED